MLWRAYNQSLSGTTLASTPRPIQRAFLAPGRECQKVRHGMDLTPAKCRPSKGLALTPLLKRSLSRTNYMHASTITVTLTLTVHSTRTSVRSILARTVLLLLFSRSPSPEITLPCGTRAVVALALRITYI